MGRVPSLQALVESFSNESGAREYQDIGLDGLKNDSERSWYGSTYLDLIRQKYGANSEAYINALEDPSTMIITISAEAIMMLKQNIVALLNDIRNLT